MARQNRRNIARNSAENGIATAATLQNAMLQHPTEAAADTVGQLRQQLEALTEALTEERDRLREWLEDQSAAHAAQLERIQTAAADERRELTAGHRQELDAIRAEHAAQLDQLRAELDDLRRELTEERRHSRAQSDTLAQLADQAQRLQLAQMQPPAQIPERKPSLLARLFGKHKHDFDIEGGQDHSPD